MALTATPTPYHVLKARAVATSTAAFNAWYRGSFEKGPPTGVPPMPADQLAHLEGCVSFRIDPHISHRSGLTAYQLITNPHTIAADSDLPIYSSKEALIRKLSKNHNAPAGTSRVIPYTDLDYALQRRFRRHVSYSIRDTTILVFDTPLVVDPMMVDPAIFERIPSLPCLTETTRTKLVSRFPNKLRVRQKSLLLGLPCVCRPLPTKSGLMRKSQADAYAEARLRFLHERGALLPNPLFERTTSLLSSIFQFSHAHAGDLEEDPESPRPYRTMGIRTRTVRSFHVYYSNRLNLPPDPTWEQEALAHKERAGNFAGTLREATVVPSPRDRRLVRVRWPHLLRILSLWHPYLPWLRDGYPPPHTKFSQNQTDTARNHFRSIRTALFAILRAHVPSHHFRTNNHLILHRAGYHKTYPHPFDFYPTYPYPSDIHSTVQRDRLSAFLDTLKATDPLPPLYPDPIPVLSE